MTTQRAFVPAAGHDRWLSLYDQHPHVDVVALDPDSKALERATRKAAHASAAVEFVRGFGGPVSFYRAARATAARL